MLKCWNAEMLQCYNATMREIADSAKLMREYFKNQKSKISNLKSPIFNQCYNATMQECFNASMQECENLGNRTSLPAGRDSAKLIRECFKNLKSPIWNLQSSINATMLQCFNAWMRECGNAWKRTSLPAWRDSAKLMGECFKNLKSPIWNLQSSINAIMLQCYNASMLQCLKSQIQRS